MEKTITGNTLEYTSRERLDLTDIILNENRVKVACEVVCFVNLQYINKVDLKELIKIYNEILAKCKELKVKKSYRNKFKNFLCQLIKDKSYEAMHQEYDEKYNHLIEFWKVKLDEGIYMGYEDDVYYTGVIRPLRDEIEQYNHVGSLLDKVQCIANSLIDIRDSLNDCDKYTAPLEVYL